MLMPPCALVLVLETCSSARRWVLPMDAGRWTLDGSWPLAWRLSSSTFTMTSNSAPPRLELQPQKHPGLAALRRDGGFTLDLQRPSALHFMHSTPSAFLSFVVCRPGHPQTRCCEGQALMRTGIVLALCLGLTTQQIEAHTSQHHLQVIRNTQSAYSSEYSITSLPSKHLLRAPVLANSPSLLQASP